jgi:hypothetical protein
VTAWCAEDVWVDAILDHDCADAEYRRALLAGELVEGADTLGVREATWDDLFGQRVEMARQHLEEMGFVFDQHWLEDTLRRISMEEYVRSTVEARARLGIAGITDA